ncbi:MAG: glycosyltransferase [Bacteroidaceae bacterium]|nr:glycosyltransferase [Bacteroidaceae bacterium]
MRTIAFISLNNPTKVQSSGIAYSIYHILKKKYNVVYISPAPISLWYRFLKLLNDVFSKIFIICGKTKINQDYLTSYIHSKTVMKELNRIPYDAVFCLDCTDFAFLNIDKPIFYRSDAIFHSYVNYYIFNVPAFLSIMGRKVEEKALKKCTYFFSTNQWTINNIKNSIILPDYTKLLLVQSGANFDKSEIIPHVREYHIDKQLNILFIGYDLKRKGIDVAVQCLNFLNDKYHVNAILTIIGGMPDETIIKNNRIRYVGKLNKNKSAERLKFHQELSKADLFIFPTKAEFSAIVNCEACAYGLPVFTYNTGGLSSYVFDDVNGRLLNLNQSGESFAESIYLALKNNKMKSYSDNCHRLYNSIFNWDVWGNIVSMYIDKVI